MRPRRTQYEIYWEILTFCRSPKTFTAIINRCDLNSKIGQEYIQFLIGKGYISEINEGEARLFAATTRANDYVALFTKLYRNLFDNSPEFKL